MLSALALGYACLAVAWAIADPPGAPPDESAHYVRAVAAGRFDLRGSPPPAVVERPQSGPDAETAAWTMRTARLFMLPDRLSQFRLTCLPVDPNQLACPDQQPSSPPPKALTYVGTYQPAGYLLPGLATRGAPDAATAVRRARLANVALWLGLIVTSALLLADRDRPGLSLIGLLLAVTPLAIFLGGSVAPNGTEIAAAVCYSASLLKVSRGPRSTAWTWAAFGVSGVLLVLGRSLGPGWAALAVLVFVILLGPRGAWDRFRDGGRASRVALTAVVLGGIASVAWEIAFQPHAGIRASVVATALRPSVEELPTLFQQYVGVFGPLTVPMRQPAYWLWGALIAAVLATAIVLGRRRERTALAVLLAVCPVATVFLSVAVVRQTGFSMQGRYVAPLLIAVPLLGGELVFRNRHRVPPELSAVAIGAVAVAVASVQALGWYTNARRYAVGSDGPRFFVVEPYWSPPGGWWLWLATVLVGTVLFVAFGVLAARRELVRRPGPVASTT